MLTSARGGAGSPGVGGATGGSGDSGGAGGTGGSSGGSGGDTMTGGAGGLSASGGTAGAGGKGTGGSAGSSGGGAGKGSGGGAGTGGASGGKGGSSGGTSGSPGMAGEGGDDGCPMNDCCPSDDTKTEPGACGCGTPDTDTDTDGTPDCLDECENDPAKTAPEACGCGIAETSCLPLKSSLLHRYSFSGTGTTVTDSKGTAHGTVMGTGAMLSGSGTLVLAGGTFPASSDMNKQHVALPPGCLDGLTDATFDMWFDWAPSDATGFQSFWQRVFDFGETAAAGTGTYLFATPRASNATGPARVSFTSSMGSTGQIFTNGATLAAARYHFTVVVDDTNDLMSLYVDGVLASSIAFPGALSAINDVNCFLGRSQFTADPYFAGTLDEFRVHNAAFTAAQVTFSHASGANATFL